MENCLFCSAKYRQDHAFFENESFFAAFDIHPVSPGHTLLIPKRHFENLNDIEPDEWEALRTSIKETIQKIATIDLRSVYRKFIESHITVNSMLFCQEAIDHPRINTQADAYNHGLNDGKAAGRTVDHLHWHIIPRYEHDVKDPRGGIRYVIPKNGNYKVPK